MNLLVLARKSKKTHVKKIHSKIGFQTAYTVRNVPMPHNDHCSSIDPCESGWPAVRRTHCCSTRGHPRTSRAPRAFSA